MQVVSEKKAKSQIVPLKFSGKWVRFKEILPFEGRKICKDAICNVITGMTGSGKSSFTEAVATHFVTEDQGKILDFYGSRDNEGLSWCRSPYGDKVLFITGNNTDVSSSWNYKHFNDVKLSDFRKYKVVLTVSAFYPNISEEFMAIRELTNLLRLRTHWKEPWFLGIREAANLLYSRISLGGDQTRAKAYFVYMLREMRHHGYAICADALRSLSIDVDVRSAAHYTIIKNVGIKGLPYELRFVYKYFEPLSLMKMKPETYIVLSRRGSIGIGKFEYPWWHKTEKEDIINLLGIKISHGEPIDYGKAKHHVDDFEHAAIIENYLKLGSQAKVAKTHQRSSRTIYNEITKHNHDIEIKGSCNRCKCIQSPFKDKKAEKH